MSHHLLGDLDTAQAPLEVSHSGFPHSEPTVYRSRFRRSPYLRQVTDSAVGTQIHLARGHAPRRQRFILSESLGPTLQERAYKGVVVTSRY